MNLNANLRNAILRSIMQDVPSPYIAEKQAQEMLFNAMSEQCKAMYVANKKALAHYTISDVCGSYSRYFYVGDADKDVVFKDVFEKVILRNNAERELKSIIESCKTLKQLERMLPEFSSHFPKPAEQIKNLPISNMVSKLVQLGWNGSAAIEHKAE